jgi:hypothetical protein
MSDTQRTSGGLPDLNTSHATLNGTYTRAVTIDGSHSVVTTATTTAGETVTTSRTQGSIRVRLIPVPARDGEPDTIG